MPAVGAHENESFPQTQRLPSLPPQTYRLVLVETTLVFAGSSGQRPKSSSWLHSHTKRSAVDGVTNSPIPHDRPDASLHAQNIN